MSFRSSLTILIKPYRERLGTTKVALYRFQLLYMLIFNMRSAMIAPLPKQTRRTTYLQLISRWIVQAAPEVSSPLKCGLQTV